MSLLWRDQVRIVLSPDRLIAVRVRLGLRARILAKEIVPIVGDGNHWQAALAALAETLKQDAWQKADAVVILSNRFASYQLLPWNGTTLSAAEQQARAGYVYAQTYGDASAALELRISEGSVGTACVVAGIEKELLEALRQIFSASTLKLVSVQPYLMSAFNQFRQKLERTTQWFVVQEHGTMCAVLLHRGTWQSLRVKQTAGNWVEDMQLILRREQISNDLAEQANTVSVCTFDGESNEFSLGADWSVQRLQMPQIAGFSPIADSAYGMALVGVR